MAGISQGEFLYCWRQCQSCREQYLLYTAAPDMELPRAMRIKAFFGQQADCVDLAVTYEDTLAAVRGSESCDVFTLVDLVRDPKGALCSFCGGSVVLGNFEGSEVARIEWRDSVGNRITIEI